MNEFLKHVSHRECFVWGLVFMALSLFTKFVADSLGGAIVFAVIALADMIIAILAKDAQRGR